MFANIYVMAVILLSWLISVIFFNSLFERRYSLLLTITAALVFGMTSALVFLLKLPPLNLVYFCAGNALLCLLMYECSAQAAVLCSLVLSALMMLSEFFVIIILHYLLGIGIEQIVKDRNIVIYSLLCKSPYLLLVLAAKKTILRRRGAEEYDETCGFFMTIPAATMILLSGLSFTIDRLSDSESVILLLSVLPLALAEFVCCIVYDYIADKNSRLKMLDSQLHKNELMLKEYELYKQKYESSRIAVHDIKKHLGVIRELSSPERADRYIESLLALDDGRIIYTNSEVLNIILNEKAAQCRRAGISFSVNISTNSVSALADNDIVAVFCNLLDNALESCERSCKKSIILEIYKMNGAFLAIDMKNSCDNPPVYKNGVLVSSKPGSGHGLGMLSVKRSISACGGDMECIYDSENRTFEVIILINTDEVK